METDLKAGVVHNTKEAVYHYYYGNGTPIDVGDEATSEVLNSDRFKQNFEAVTTKKEQKIVSQ